MFQHEKLVVFLFFLKGHPPVISALIWWVTTAVPAVSLIHYNVLDDLRGALLQSIYPEFARSSGRLRSSAGSFCRQDDFDSSQYPIYDIVNPFTLQVTTWMVLKGSVPV